MNRLAIFFVFVLSVITAKSQSDTLVSLVCTSPGTEIYELEGHAAIHLRLDADRDFVISYGQFDFNSPNFGYRFVSGQTDYHVALYPWSSFIYQYQYQGAERTIIEHPIKLTGDEVLRLAALLEENLRPENREYRYNYVKDNCATRPLQMIERTIGREIALGPAPEPFCEGATTFRDVMRYYHRNYPWYQFGIDICLGSGIDYPLSRREMAFAPTILTSMLTPDADSIVGEARVYEPESGVTSLPTPWYLSPIFVCYVFFVIGLWVTIRQLRTGKQPRVFDTFYFGVKFLCGILVTFLIFVSVHEATSPNMLLMWLNPLAIIPCIFLWIKSAKKAVNCYHFCNFALVFAMCAVWPLQNQVANAAFWPIIFTDLMRSGTHIYLFIKEKRDEK